jgi:uncharacterized protein (TIGR00730 family)
MVSICVFCGSRDGARPEYLQAAMAFGRELARREMTLVYGGGRIGLMGAMADAVLASGGSVVGVIPDFLGDREVAHTGLTECVLVDDLFERKAIMIERSDAFVALPGGIGTFDEILEVIAWRQLRQLRQPIGLLNVANFFAPWQDLLRHCVDEGFVSASELAHIVVDSDPIGLLDAMLDFQAS